MFYFSSSPLFCPFVQSKFATNAEDANMTEVSFKKKKSNPFTFMIEMGANILKLGFKISQISQILYVGVILNANGFLCTNYLGFIIPKYEECIFFFIFAYYYFSSSLSVFSFFQPKYLWMVLCVSKSFILPEFFGGLNLCPTLIF